MKENRLIVMVHAFDCETYESQPRFIKAREEAISSNLPLVVMTNLLETTKARLGNRVCRVYITKEANPEPLVGWESFSQDIRDYKLPVLFMGAELSRDLHGRFNGGCVLDAFKRTLASYKSVDPSRCYVTGYRFLT
jgi:hypothetical protein